MWPLTASKIQTWIFVLLLLIQADDMLSCGSQIQVFPGQTFHPWGSVFTVGDNFYSKWYSGRNSHGYSHPVQRQLRTKTNCDISVIDSGEVFKILTKVYKISNICEKIWFWYYFIPYFKIITSYLHFHDKFLSSSSIPWAAVLLGLHPSCLWQWKGCLCCLKSKSQSHPCIGHTHLHGFLNLH